MFMKLDRLLLAPMMVGIYCQVTWKAFSIIRLATAECDTAQ